MERAMTRRKNFSKVDGISKFQVMVYVPFSDHFKASDRLCICQNCQIEIGSCCLFRKFTISADELYPSTLRSKNTVETSIDNEKEEEDEEEGEDENLEDFMPEGSIVAVAADSKSDDSVWFIQIIGSGESDSDIIDDYGNTIPARIDFLKGHFLEREHTNKTSQLFKISKKTNFFYRESVFYPFVPFHETKKGLRLDNKDLTDILCYIDKIKTT